MARGPTLPHIGHLPAGPRNAITDVAGVTVGHATLDRPEEDVHTGVTVVRPHAGSPYLQRVPAGVAVLNGFGKSLGLMQVEELGVLESPIALTSTFAVPAVAEAQMRQCVAAHPECGRGWPTVNPLVLECNDGFLSDQQRFAVREADYLAAWQAADAGFALGAVGAGRGMSCHGLKGGIGTASRRIAVDGGAEPAWTVGALVLTNQGRPEQLQVAGRPVGAWLHQAGRTAAATAPERGSIIMLLATDAPLDARQLRRLALRAGAGLARTGSVFGHGSGDIALAFSTAYTLPQLATEPMPAVALLHDARLDPFFQAAADSVEQAILSALWHAPTLRGRAGHVRHGLCELLAEWPADAFTRALLPVMA
ncbi:DmpA family aminopeptidase [Pseudacidovorax intermedius]|uniref:D-aminopeptidase n=1 Tax=Pseudacidovorax intermedius TaxID=433924 RepID=A0A147GSE2_9BURK|nr:P1 family peptidase [Pseudacidovorax intermedius]KTT20104.1 D-aminopeptidase [Pseudacidovorax intermedius]